MVVFILFPPKDLKEICAVPGYEHVAHITFGPPCQSFKVVMSSQLESAEVGRRHPEMLPFFVVKYDTFKFDIVYLGNLLLYIVFFGGFSSYCVLSAQATLP